MRRLLLVLLLLLAAAPVAAPVRAQDEYVRLARRHAVPPVLAAAFALPGSEAAALVVTFRVPNPLLVFVQEGEGAARSFNAAAEVTVEVLPEAATEGSPVATARWRGTQRAATFEATQARTEGLAGTVRFDLPPGVYGYRVTVRDAGSGRERTLPVRRTVVPAYEHAALGSPLMTSAAPAPGTPLPLVGLGGDVRLGAPGHAVLPVSLGPSTDPVGVALQYALRRLGPVGESGAEDVSGSSAEGALVRRGAVAGADFVAVPALPPGAPAPHALAWTGGPARAYLAAVDLGGLADGAYVLEAALPGVDTVRVRFRTRWPDRPLALYEPDVALDLLRFIEPRETVRALRAGRRSERADRLARYWAERDPTPDTPLNELMTEYYRRVDHAATAFQTGLFPFPDGLETDRGAIYVVHGAPSRVERRLAGVGVEEVWAYPDGRRFVFRSAGGLEAFELQASQ